MILFIKVGPDSSEVEHLHGKQKVVGSSPILGKGIKQINLIPLTMEDQ